MCVCVVLIAFYLVRPAWKKVYARDTMTDEGFHVHVLKIIGWAKNFFLLVFFFFFNKKSKLKNKLSLSVLN